MDFEILTVREDSLYFRSSGAEDSVCCQNAASGPNGTVAGVAVQAQS